MLMDVVADIAAPLDESSEAALEPELDDPLEEPEEPEPMLPVEPDEPDEPDDPEEPDEPDEPLLEPELPLPLPLEPEPELELPPDELLLLPETRSQVSSPSRTCVWSL